jgi:hypothetical protein
MDEQMIETNGGKEIDWIAEMGNTKSSTQTRLGVIVIRHYPVIGELAVSTQL